MLSSKRALSFILAGVAGLALLAGPSHASTPAQGGGIVARRALVDQNGVPFDSVGQVGYKVFVATAGVSPIQLTDENGFTVTDGSLHQVCVSSGAITEYAVAYDSSVTSGFSAANQATNVIYEVMPVVNRVTTGEHCSPILDAQFSYGLVLYMSTLGGSGTAHFYWRPITGGAN